MVKKIILAIILILSVAMIAAENETLEKSYDFDYIAEDTTIEFVSQVDNVDKTVLTYVINSTPGEYSISGGLGTKSTQINTIYETDVNEFTLEFEKLTEGDKEFFLAIYRDDSLIVLLTNKTITVENEVKIAPSYDSTIVNDGKLQVFLTIDTTLELSNSSLILISNGQTIESEEANVLSETGVSYTFTPQLSGEYSFYQLDVDGFIKELKGSIGSFDFDIIKNIADEKTEEGLIISFESSCDCEKEVLVLTTEGDYVYQQTITENSILIPSENISSSMLNGPYKVFITADGAQFEYETSEYNYGDFDAQTENETVEEVVEEEIVQENQNTGSGSSVSTTEEVLESQNATVEDNQTLNNASEIETVNESVEVTEEVTEVENDTVTIEDDVTEQGEESNKVTGFSISNLTEKISGKTKILGIAALAIIVLLLVYMFVIKGNDSYLYDM
ncbi:hypothetical protein BVX95_01755 [archaeon D22]|nr:hypothetical protein BVX95_01755 [archaeon D22]